MSFKTKEFPRSKGTKLLARQLTEIVPSNVILTKVDIEGNTTDGVAIFADELMDLAKFLAHAAGRTIKVIGE